MESKLGQYQQIKLDDSDAEISHDVERYVFAKVAQLASEQNFSEEMAAQVQQALLAGADGTFLWVGFVANELQGKSWREINEILRRVPKGLGGIYQRLLQQIDDNKEALVPVLQWIVLAARPLTVGELIVATGTKTSGTFSATEVIKNRLSFCGLLVNIERDVVNLVHESAKEFFQSDQVNTKGISMFRMSQERVGELLGLQEQIFLARYKRASRKVGIIMKTLSLSFRFPIILHLMSLYLKFMTFDRWEHMSVLQELVKENKTDELRQWAEAYREFFVQLVVARNRTRLTAMTDLPTQVFRAVAPGDLQALLVIAVLVGSETKLAAVRHGWRERIHRRQPRG